MKIFRESKHIANDIKHLKCSLCNYEFLDKDKVFGFTNSSEYGYRRYKDVFDEDDGSLSVEKEFKKFDSPLLYELISWLRKDIMEQKLLNLNEQYHTIQNCFILYLCEKCLNDGEK